MSENEKTYVRFSVDQRIEHFILIFSFFVLGLTGLPQKFPLFPVSEFLLRILGGIETVRFIHRFSAFVMMIQALFHVLSVGYRLFVLRAKPAMLPTTKDIFDAVKQVGYNLGFSKERPKMDRFNFAEKAEYWALVWGTLIMGITGFMLWNPIATTQVLPGQIVPAAKAAHGAEAILAVLAIFLWHFYFVHIKEWNWSMFTGRLKRHQMEEEHAAELERLETRIEEKPMPPEIREKRQMIFFPVAVLFTITFLFLVFFFTSYEETAIATLPEAEWEVEAFSPQTNTPIPTPFPTATPEAGETAPGVVDVSGLTWESEIQGLMQQKCFSCHGQLGGLNLETYDALLEGGTNGPAVVAGDPAAGTLVSVQEKGGHPGQFTPEELDLIKAWIAAGAPAGEGAQMPAEEEPVDLTALSWENEIGELFQTKCASCHGEMARLSVETYESLLEGGVSGPAIAPDNVAAGTLLPLMESGSHYAQFSEEELGWVKAWIENGAPQE